MCGQSTGSGFFAVAFCLDLPDSAAPDGIFNYSGQVREILWVARTIPCGTGEFWYLAKACHPVTGLSAECAELYL